MKRSDKNKLNSGMKILGASLLLIAIPGSVIALPWLIHKLKKDSGKDKTEEFLGI